ncbi:MAG: replicative DNA helicase [Planctomycetaceae bacterium]|nr:replicative DNA helicase [Planctomycetaceae bacterium]
MSDSPKNFLDRLPPQDLEAERSVLGSCLLQNNVIDDVLTLVRGNYFYSDGHQKLFAAMLRMHEQGIRGIDAVTLGHELQNRGELELVGGPSALLRILETVPHAAHAEYYARIVRDKWLQRTLIDVCTETLRETYDSAEDTEQILARAEQRVFAIVEQQEQIDKFAIRDILDDTFARIFERMDQEGTISGLHTGFDGLDSLTSGFQSSELLILAARPSMGKTALVCNFALAVARQERQGVLIFSLEQSKLELAERFLCIQARINGHKLRQGDLDEVEQHSLHEASNEMREFPLFIDDTAGRTVSQVAAVARRLKRRFGLGLVIIDYLQLIESDDKNVPREQQISTITRRLKFLAKDLSIPVIALAQLNRGVEQREDKRPRLADLRESGAIEQDADLVMFLHRPEAYDPEDRPGEADLIVAKNRNGPIGNVPLVWLREQLRFGDRAPSGVADALPASWN